MSNPLFHEGSPPPLGTRDQIAAAARDTAARAAQQLANGARGGWAQIATAPPVYRALVDAVNMSAREARQRYENSVPRSQWVAGRRRFDTCEHLHSAPGAPGHWWAGTVYCTRCSDDIEESVTNCSHCGRHDHDLTRITVIGEGGTIAVHGAVCDGCHPEGADAPRTAQYTGT
jgi:hypothetical protein